MKRFLITAFVFTALLVGVLPCFARQLPVPDSTLRVRVTAPDFDLFREEGTYSVVSDGAIEFISDDATVTLVPLRSLTHVEVHDGRKRHWLRGAVIGFVPTTLLAMVLLAVDPGESLSTSEIIGVG